MLIHGNKVVLKPFLPSDVTPKYVEWLNDKDVVKYSNQRFINHTTESCFNYLESFTDSSNLFLSIYDIENGIMIGTMTAYFCEHHFNVDLGIMVGDKKSWGKGYGQDAWDYALKSIICNSKVRKVTGGAMRANKAMIKIMKKSGMVQDGIRNKHELLEGIPQDLLYFGLNSSVWKV